MFVDARGAATRPPRPSPFHQLTDNKGVNSSNFTVSRTNTDSNEYHGGELRYIQLTSPYPPPPPSFVHYALKRRPPL